MEKEERKDASTAFTKTHIKLDSKISPSPTLIGDCKLTKLLGKGSFGHVYLANDKTGKAVAVKELQLAGSEEKDRRKVYNEVRILKAVTHENVVRLHDVVETPHSVYIIMEYCQGGDLAQYLKAKKQLDEYEVQEIVYQVAQGLKELYRKDIMHRDIKLQNLLRSTEDGPTKIKIADFGLARYATGYASTICGTLPYMAPEVLKGTKYSTKAELWSLGVAIYTLLTGKMPFPNLRPQTMLSEISKSLLCVHYKLEGMKVSGCCKDLIKQLLVADYKKRIDKLKFFAHPFVRTPPLTYRQLNPRISTAPSKMPSEAARIEDSLDGSEGTVFYKSSSEASSPVTSLLSSPRDDQGRVPNKV